MGQNRNNSKYKRRNLSPSEKEQKLRSRRYTERVEGESFYYFMLHNLVSGGLFLIITTFSGIWEIKATSLLNLFTAEFLELIFFLFIIYSLTSILGRVIAFFLMKYLLKANKKIMRKFWNINQGMNKIGVIWLISILISSFIFAFGIVALLQNAIYDESTFLTLIATYVFVRIIVYGILKLISYLKF